MNRFINTDASTNCLQILTLSFDAGKVWCLCDASVYLTYANTSCYFLGLRKEGVNKNLLIKHWIQKAQMWIHDLLHNHDFQSRRAHGTCASLWITVKCWWQQHLLVSNPDRKSKNKQRFWRWTWFWGLTMENNSPCEPEKHIICSYMANKTFQTLSPWETAHPLGLFPNNFSNSSVTHVPGWYSSSARSVINPAL